MDKAKLSEINGKSPEYVAAVNKFAATPRGFLFIAGQNGRGKSYTAEAVYNELPNPYMENAFWNVKLLHERWKERMATWGEVGYLIEQLTRGFVLVLDDICVNKKEPTEAFLDFLYIVIEKRYQNRAEKVTIVTTNLIPEEMATLLGSAVATRIASGMCLTCTGPNRHGEM